MYKALVKPIFDIVTAVVALVLLAPVFLLVAILLTWHHRGSPFFLQKRPGKNTRIFKIIKFKTMSDAKDEQGHLLPDAQRLHSIGKWVRKTSLDEIPQLLNVVMGQMSLVGPRPLLMEYIGLYNNFQQKRHLVKPGITGWAQVNGRNAINWNVKFELDVFYVQNLTFALDLKILFKTIKKVFAQSGINAAGQATTEPFKGNP